MHLPGHNFTGPGTKLKKRLGANDQPHPWSKPINRVDRAAMKHDICYRDNKLPRVRRELCDRQMVDEMANIPDPTLRERVDRGFAGSFIRGKMKLWVLAEVKRSEVIKSWESLVGDKGCTHHGKQSKPAGANSKIEAQRQGVSHDRRVFVKNTQSLTQLCRTQQEWENS